MPDQDVVVTGLGLVTPAGIGVTATWERVLAGIPTAATVPDLAGRPVDFACRVPAFDPARQVGQRQAWRLDRYTQFAVTAAREALTDAGLDPGTWDGSRVSVVVGSSFGGTIATQIQHERFLKDSDTAVSSQYVPMTLPNMAAAQVALDLKAQGPVIGLSTACASGASAIATARALLRAGRADVAVAGGSDAAVTPFISAAFSRMRALSTRCADPAGASRPFDADRDGFVLGEGAGLVVLESAAHARRRGATVRARLAGCGATADAHHLTAPHPQGRGATQAIRAALADARLAPHDIDHVNAHGTSTPQGDLAEARAIRTALRTDVPVTSAKGVLGHCLGAAGAIEAALSVLTLQYGVIPPTANLTSPDPAIDLHVVTGTALRRQVAAVLTQSFGFGGHNEVLVLTAP
ncbi:beta-ketoacyl-[acyl-carrier-protein] synthase family protein [Streptomyces sp. NPDC020799]|uniref:beta-ketoacyl-[acyl-carrier-protein] synthase family protein n=1 Tax=Streptomyces sp. NPDC020799 TaxID=3365091 RepID=UPI00379536AB